MADTKLEELLKEPKPEEDPVPGRYADDASFGFILLSGAAFFSSILSLLLDEGQESSVFFMFTATYFSLLYIALDQK